MPLLCTGQQTNDDRKRLERDKKENLQKIKEAQRILSETSSQRESTLGQLNAINQQIEARESLIKSITEEIEILSTQIGEVGSVINALEEDLVNLKNEYAYMVYAASKNTSSYDRLMFIFSSGTFNQLFARVKYMQQYSQARKNQIEQIQKVKETLVSQKEVIEGKQMEQKVLLDQQTIASQDLLALKTKQRAVVRELGERATELKREVEVRRREINKLESVIAKLIKNELKKERSIPSTNSEAVLAASAESLSTSFAENKKRLGWPVATGFVSQKFGPNPHPVMKNIMVPNDGVDIQTNRDAEVKAVFDGIVKMIASLPGPGNNKAVIVQHGEYFTVYSRLKEVAVKQGQSLRLNDAVGLVYTDGNGVSALQFQIWHNQEKLNPETWLQRK
ncbi:MAG: peptidoglycan DD-metalloendopeptidase family protein [Tunicatimonas sp.]